MPVLPPVQPPPGAVLLFEEVPLGQDRTAGWRAALDSSGGYRVARNRPLFVPEDRSADPDPSLFWNVPWPDEPQVRLPTEGVGRILAAARAAGVERMDPFLPTPPGELVSDGLVDRWTFRLDGRTVTVTVENPQLWRAGSAPGAEWWETRRALAGIHDAIAAEIEAARR